MEALNRLTESLDWISIIILGCLLSVAIARQFTTLSLTEFLSVYTSSRFIKITQDGRVDNYRPYQTLGIIVYGIGISLIVYKLYGLYHEAGIADFILITTAVTAFLLFKHYLSKLIGTVGDFEGVIQKVDHQRNLYRAVLSVVLILTVILIYYVIPNYPQAILIASCIVGGIILSYHLLLIYSHRSLLFSSVFYFILYLCTLEIAPYLLLYKYITA